MFLLCLEYTSCIFDGADKRIWLFLLEIKIGTEQQFVAVSKQTMEIIKKKKILTWVLIVQDCKIYGIQSVSENYTLSNI